MREGRAHVQIEGRRAPLLYVQCAQAEESECRLRLPLDVMQGKAEWREVDDLSDEDSSNMDALEEAMREDWLSSQSSESQQIADDAEEFFNSLDPKSWVE